MSALTLFAAAGIAVASPRRADPPQAAITKEPKAKIAVSGGATATATWEFTADRKATFTCKLSGYGAVGPCRSPITFSGLGTGRHTFTVYAFDLLVSPDTTRARDVIDVVAKKKHK